MAIASASGRTRLVEAVLVALGALLLTALSSVVSGTRLEVQDWDCPPAPASCARPMLVKGFPLPYISDFHGISPVGSAGLLGAILGEDLFHPLAFWGDVVIYAVVLSAIVLLRGRPTRSGRGPA